MPSSNKTPSLFLNRWLGSDKPKREDFNNDNEKLDEAHRALIEQFNTAQSGLSSHTGNSSVHVTAAEKASWNAGIDNIVTGTYVGTGQSSRTISFGCRARFGFVYAVGKAILHANWSDNDMLAYCAFFGADGCSEGVNLTETGITVTNNTGRPLDGSTPRYNETSVTYVYVVWPEK